MDSYIISLNNCLNSSMKSFDFKSRNINAKNDIGNLCSMIECAMILSLEYDNTTDEDLKHEFGFQYSEIVDAIEEAVIQLNELGMNFYIH